MGVFNKMMNYFGLQEEEEIVERVHEPQEEIETIPLEGRKNKGNVVSIHSQKQARVVLSEPHSYDESQEIADHLRSRRTVIVNLQRVRADHGMRIVDFLSGTVYALNGTIAKIGPNIFICTPDNVDVQGVITDLFEDETAESKSR